jgi:hypothetical protein
VKNPIARLVLVVGFTGVAFAATSSAPQMAAAQTTPAFTYAKPDEPKKDAPAVEWKVQVKGGGVITTGNSEAKNGTLGASASRKEGNNKLALDGGIAYGTTNALEPLYDPADPTMKTISGLDRRSITTTNSWLAKGRYDRFFTPNNAGYVSAQGAGDKIAGKSFYGGGQIGYSRQLVQSKLQLVVAELGYDFSYEQYVQANPAVSVHSARVFVGETLTLTPQTGVTGSVEALFNINKEDKALNASKNGAPGVDPFKDTRVVGKVGITTTLLKALSFGFSFALKYDQNPAALPVPPTANPGAAFATTPTPFVPFADKVDTSAEATLIYTFL